MRSFSPAVVGLIALALCGSCATTPTPKSEVAADVPGCLSPCAPGYECSSIVVHGVKTGLCISGPVECSSDADCANSAVVPGTVPLRYACDKHSGAFPDKTGSSVVADRGTCMPTEKTGMDR
jgi:hypothetical protein